MLHREQEAITVLQQLISNFPRSPLAAREGSSLVNSTTTWAITSKASLPTKT